LTDLTGSSDPLQAELDKTSQTSQIELELAQMKGELAPPAPAPAEALAPGSAASLPDGAEADAEPADGETVEEAPPASQTAAGGSPDGAAGSDLFSLGSEGGNS